MDKLYILGNPGDKVKISLVGRAQRVRNMCAGVRRFQRRKRPPP
jgi:hypothetical protein